MKPTPLRVDVPEEVMNDLRFRLGRTRWPLDLGNEDWSYGTNAEYLRSFCSYWVEDFDWAIQAERINAYSHARVVVDGLPIHFLHASGDDENSIPILLLHGWPWTFWDFHGIIELLRHAQGGQQTFDVVIPSLPGFIYSTPLPRTGIAVPEAADAFATLMTDVLGYQRFVVHASDLGGVIAAQLGHKHYERIIALHTTAPGPPNFFGGERPWDIGGGAPPAQLPPAVRERILQWQASTAAHVAAHVLDPQSLSYGPHDSPAALAAWILNRRYHYSDCRGDLANSFSRDDLCTLLTLYWATESFVTSVRFYREAALHPWSRSHDLQPVVQAPTGVTQFTVDLPREMLNEDVIRMMYNLVYYRQREVGGHFAAAESPEAVVEDIRTTVERARG